jgi:hypothetical protein
MKVTLAVSQTTRYLRVAIHTHYYLVKTLLPQLDDEGNNNKVTSLLYFQCNCNGLVATAQSSYMSDFA